MQTETTIIERIREIIRNENISVETFSRITGISKYTLDSMFKKETNPSFDNLNKIINAYTQYSLDWLIKGKGNMLKAEAYGTPDSPTSAVSAPEEPYFILRDSLQYSEMPNGKFHIRVPLVPIRAYEKHLTKLHDSGFLNKLGAADFIVDEIKAGHYFAFEIKGDSMDDDSRRSICDKDIVLARELEGENWHGQLLNDEYPFWIIVLDKAIVCKQIVEHDEEHGEIVCHSLNPSPEYADFCLPLSNVRQLCNIVAKQSNSF
ncbi:helix-turn-helix domain-containing protein [Viscerimonas tarda]